MVFGFGGRVFALVNCLAMRVRPRSGLLRRIANRRSRVFTANLFGIVASPTEWAPTGWGALHDSVGALSSGRTCSGSLLRPRSGLLRGGGPCVIP
jgi:hypothetical protein